MKLSCPWCDAVGTDVEPVPERLRGPSWTPSKGEDDYAVEVRGNLRSRPVRKCLTCGKGIRVTILPPRFRKYEATERERFDTTFAQLQGERPARVEETLGADDTPQRKVLMDDVEAELPSDNDELEPVSRIIAMPNPPSAPMISISRDPRIGPRLAPVFWIGAIDDELLREVGMGLFASTDGKALLWHTLRHGASPSYWFH